MKGSILKQIWKEKWIFRFLIQSIFFNFHYLPFRQAIKLPILLYKPKFISLKGRVIISASHVKTGMIILGSSMFPYIPIKVLFLKIMAVPLNLKENVLLGTIQLFQ